MEDVATIFEEEKRTREETLETIAPDIKNWAAKGGMPINVRTTLMARKKKIEAE